MLKFGYLLVVVQVQIYINYIKKIVINKGRLIKFIGFKAFMPSTP